MENFILENFKYLNYKLKIISTNMFFSKTILLISVKLPQKIVYVLKKICKRFCYLQAYLGI